MSTLVTISILNYRRRDALERVLDSVFVQDYPELEVIVIDNGSGEETTSWIRQQYPRVRLFALPVNIGTVARNEGLLKARGNIVITLDNDVYFDRPDAVRRVVEAFERHPRAGCLAFRVYHPAIGKLNSRDWCHPRPWQEAEHLEFETDYITEGAAAFRQLVFEEIEPYWKELFIAQEGYDLALRLLDAGYEIWYTPEVKVWHMASLETREDWRPFYFHTRNLFPAVYRNLPLASAASHLIPRLALLGIYAVKNGFVRRYISGLMDGIRSLPAAHSQRKVIRRETLRKIALLRSTMPGPITRFMRHWRKPEL